MGRPTPAMIAYAKELKLDNSYMISYNGAVITDLKEDKIIFEQMLTQDQIHELYEYSLKSKTHIITYIDGKVVSETNLNISISSLTLQDYYIIKF
jgi:hydroxymethylpyrimidine pyrophosphatase-like HAD family hydrolase